MAKPISYAQWSLDPYCIGMKLRALRTQKHLTLSKLATETGLSTALLSKLETDRMIPTLPTLATICRVYGVSLSHFFCEPGHHALSITRKAHLQRTVRGSDVPSATPLHFPTTRPRLKAQMLTVPNSGTENCPESDSAAVCGLFYVIEGRLQLKVGGLEETLESGDCAYIDTEMPICWSAQGNDCCRVLSVSPPATPQ